MTLSNSKRKNDSFNELEKNTKQTEIEGIIKDVKIQIRKHYAGIKEQIERIGCVLKANKLIEENDICTEIKNALREEINDKIISSDTIERCCPDAWKRKTKPKTKDPQLRFLEGKNSLEQETVTNVNTNVTSGGQILFQEQDLDDHSKMEEQNPEEVATDLSKQQQQQEDVAHIPREQVPREQEELHRLKIENRQQREEIENLLSELNKLKVKEEQEEEVSIENKLLIIGEIQLALLIAVNYRQKKVESVKLDLENYQY